MAEAVYLLCALTSLGCAVLLVRGYRQTRNRLLFWSAVSFCLFFLNNLLLFVDLVLVPDTLDLSLARGALGLTAAGVLVWGLVGVSVPRGRS
jgi:hypothetical protein